MTTNETKVRSGVGKSGGFIVDVREISNISSEYFYNFYSGNGESRYINEINVLLDEPKSASSYAKIKFNKPATSQSTSGDLINYLKGIQTKDLIEMIFNENDFAGNAFTGITTQIPNEIEDLRNLIKESSSILINSQNSEQIYNQSTTDFIKSFSGNLKSSGFLFSDTSKDQLGKFFKNISNENLGRNETKNTNRFLDFDANSTYYSPILNDMASEIKRNPTSIFSNAIVDQRSKLISIANSGIDDSKKSLLDNYYPTISEEKLITGKSFLPSEDSSTLNVLSNIYNNIAHVGYVIEVTLDLESGNLINLDKKIILKPDCQEFYLENIPYNSNIGIKIRSLFMIVIPLRNNSSSTGKTITSGGLLVAGSGVSTLFKAVDLEPPPPPQDVSFELTKKGLQINWSLPFNKQRDITKFRVFRRKNKNEPFTLIRQLDFGGFHDTNIPRNINDYLGIGNVKTFFIDKEFDQNSEFIYAVACVDVHDLVSNYSEQIHVKINPVFNRLETRLFARIGAYIQYPNMTMESEIFTDVIKTSGYDKMKVYFNPDFLKVTREENGSHIDLVSINSEDDNQFKINLINIDLQTQQNLDIIIGERVAVSEFDSDDSAIIRSFID